MSRAPFWMCRAGDNAMRFERNGRFWTALFVILGVWLTLLALYVFLNAAIWIIALFVLLTLPAAWDFATARRAGLQIDDDTIRWFSGRFQGDMARHLLDHVRLSRRLDMTMRVALVTRDGRRIRLPQECTPPLPQLETALDAAGIRVERHPFSLM